MRLFAVLLVAGLVAVAGASAKPIGPGDVLVCGASRCRAVDEPAQARALSELLWGSGRVVRAATPRVGSAVYQLHARTRHGHQPLGAAVNATSIRVHGLNCGRFRRGKWYRLPAALRGFTSGLSPKRLTVVVPRSC